MVIDGASADNSVPIALPMGYIYSNARGLSSTLSLFTVCDLSDYFTRQGTLNHLHK
jgi:hypothetical protein